MTQETTSSEASVDQQDIISNEEEATKVSQNISEALASLPPFKPQIRNKKAICAVADCPNPSGIAYHLFPRDPKYRKVWIQRCKRDDKVGKPLDPNNANIRICATHFTKDDYFTNVSGTRTSLKQNVVPSVFPNRKVPKHALSSGLQLHKVLKKKNPPKKTQVVLPPPTETTPRSVRRNPCIVPGCKRPLNVCLHRFPKEEDQENNWLHRLQLDNLLKEDGSKRTNAKVCSAHFVNDQDYEVMTNAQEIQVWSNILKKNAVPSRNILLSTEKPLFPPQPPPEQDKILEEPAAPEPISPTQVLEDNIGIHFDSFASPREERLSNRDFIKKARDLIKVPKETSENSEANNAPLEPQESTNSEDIQPQDSEANTVPPKPQPETKEAGVQHSPVKGATDPREDRIKELEALLKEERDKVVRGQLKIKRLQEQVENPSQTIIKKHLTRVLEAAKMPKSQIHCIVHKKKYTWLRNDPEGLAQAAVEFAINSQLYNHIRKRPGSLYRPHRTTLARHFQHFQVTKGFQDDSIDVLEKMLHTTEKKLYKHALIAFDEVAIKGDEVEMDKRTQTVYGPHSKMQVVSIRGLGPK